MVLQCSRGALHLCPVVGLHPLLEQLHHHLAGQLGSDNPFPTPGPLLRRQPRRGGGLCKVEKLQEAGGGEGEGEGEGGGTTRERGFFWVRYARKSPR